MNSLEELGELGRKGTVYTVTLSLDVEVYVDDGIDPQEAAECLRNEVYSWLIDFACVKEVSAGVDSVERGDIFKNFRYS